LSRKGYKLLNEPRKSGEKGADIIAQRSSKKIFIECIGLHKARPVRSKHFFEGFFRTISRLEDGEIKCVLALPIGFKCGMNRRAKQYGEAWRRIGNAFPELKIWFVDIKRNVYEENKWNDWPKA